MVKKLVTFTGPTAAGKTTLLNALSARGAFIPVVSFTSRQPRDGEVEGVDYYFKTKEECLNIINTQHAVESTHFKGNYYGIEEAEINRCMKSPMTAGVIVEPHGMFQLRTLYPCASVYVGGDLHTLYTRFLARYRDLPKPNADYEARRLMAIHEEAITWRNSLSPKGWEFLYETFTKENEESIISELCEFAQGNN